MKRLADRPQARARARRRAYPIHGYVGSNGTGKSACMVLDTIPSLDAGRPVLSTVRLLDYRNPRPCELDLRACDDPGGHLAGHRQAHPLYERFHDYQQLLDWRGGDVLLDEVTGIASSRESSKMPAAVANYLVQLRRRDVSLRWTAPAWGRADIIIRECSQAVTLMAAYCAKRGEATSDGTPRLWMQRRLFEAKTYDPTAMDEFETHRVEDIKPEVTAFYWGPGSLMFAAYDTHDPVAALTQVIGGTCLRCDGKRIQPRCECEAHDEGRRAAVRRVPKREPVAVPVVQAVADLEVLPADSGAVILPAGI